MPAATASTQREVWDKGWLGAAKVPQLLQGTFAMSYLFYSCLSHFSEVCSVTTAVLEEP